MGENTKIEWAHHSFNPWYGCQKVSPACDHCYAEGWAKRSGLVQWGAGAERRRSSPSNWKDPIKWNAEAQRMGIRYRVFCASLADVFDNAVPGEWRTDLWALIRATPHLDWLLLTKRISNALEMLPPDWGDGYPNVWLMATVTNQTEADRDIPKLLSVPAVVRGLSMEPLLGPVRLDKPNPVPSRYDDHGNGVEWIEEATWLWRGGIDWVVVGGETGVKGRPLHPIWVRNLHDQCKAGGVPFLFKQWGEWAPNCLCNRPYACVTTKRPEPGNMGVMFRCGKKAAGRLLDGQLHDGYPEYRFVPKEIEKQEARCEAR